jgi:Ca2+-binding EF-hand superfamily protein
LAHPQTLRSYENTVPAATISAEAQRIISTYDANGDGDIALDEVIAVWGGVREQQLKAVFSE